MKLGRLTVGAVSVSLAVAGSFAQVAANPQDDTTRGQVGGSMSRCWLMTR